MLILQLKRDENLLGGDTPIWSGKNYGVYL